MPQIGKRKKLQIARRLPTIKETKEKDESCFLQYTQPIHNPFEKCVDELYEKYNDVENFPVFCYLEKEQLRNFLNYIFTRWSAGSALRSAFGPRPLDLKTWFLL